MQLVRAAGFVLELLPAPEALVVSVVVQRVRGHSHGRALRTLADRWLTALVAMLRTHETFDAARWNACVITPQATL